MTKCTRPAEYHVLLKCMGGRAEYYVLLKCMGGFGAQGLARAVGWVGSGRGARWGSIQGRVLSLAVVARAILISLVFERRAARNRRPFATGAFGQVAVVQSSSARLHAFPHGRDLPRVLPVFSRAEARSFVRLAPHHLELGMLVSTQHRASRHLGALDAFEQISPIYLGDQGGVAKWGLQAPEQMISRVFPAPQGPTVVQSDA